MIIQHNMQAMNANRMLGITTGQQSKSTEKLSSGYRINRAADDAAGLTISEKMRKQIRGLDRASTNAQDGISCVQTAEGALTEVHSMLQRMNELAVQAANGTMSKDDRQAVQDEIDQLVTEIDRVSETTKFNEIYLLKGAEGTGRTETVTTKEAATTVAYKDTITGQKTLEFVTAGNTLYATKEGVSTEVTDANYNDFFEVGTVTEVTGTNPQDAADAVTAGTDYTITNGTAITGAGTITVDDQTKLDAAIVGTVCTYDAANTNWKDAGGTVVTLADYGITVGGTLADGDTITITAQSVTHAGDIYAENGTTALTDAEILAAVTAGDTLYSTAAEITETTETDSVVVKDGYQIYKVDADETTKFGDQITPQVASSDDIADKFVIGTDLLLDQDGNSVAADKLSEYFESDGVYKGGLYKYSDPADPDTLTEIGAEQMDNYVVWNKTEAETTDRTVVDPLEFNLHVGSESADSNKIGVKIESMSASGIGVDVLKETGLMTEDDATAAIDTISEAIARVSKQRSALGAVQNRLEHTIANLDNVVENTTAAESRIRDLDMAEEMVTYSKNNILAQAGQSMLAQANQSTQGVLSLLG